MPRRPPARRGAARDSDATKAALVAAVGHVLARHGFAALNVKAVAEQAGVDRKLVYRCFGGLPGLVRAFALEGGFFPSLEELCGGDVEGTRALPPAARLARVFRNYAQGLRARPATQEILAWETVERNEMTAILEDARERLARDVNAKLWAGLGDADPVVDAPAATAVLAAAINYLVVQARKIRTFSEVDLRTDEGWERLCSTVELMLEGVVRR